MSERQQAEIHLIEMRLNNLSTTVRRIDDSLGLIDATDLQIIKDDVSRIDTDIDMIKKILTEKFNIDWEYEERRMK